MAFCKTGCTLLIRTPNNLFATHLAFTLASDVDTAIAASMLSLSVSSVAKDWPAHSSQTRAAPYENMAMCERITLQYQGPRGIAFKPFATYEPVINMSGLSNGNSIVRFNLPSLHSRRDAHRLMFEANYTFTCTACDRSTTRGTALICERKQSTFLKNTRECECTAICMDCLEDYIDPNVPPQWDCIAPLARLTGAHKGMTDIICNCFDNIVDTHRFDGLGNSALAFLNYHETMVSVNSFLAAFCENEASRSRCSRICTWFNSTDHSLKFCISKVLRSMGQHQHFVLELSHISAFTSLWRRGAAVALVNLCMAHINLQTKCCWAALTIEAIDAVDLDSRAFLVGLEKDRFIRFAGQAVDAPTVSVYKPTTLFDT